MLNCSTENVPFYTKYSKNDIIWGTPLINARNNDKISEADRFIILGGKFFIKLPQLLRPQPRVRATDRNLTHVAVRLLYAKLTILNFLGHKWKSVRHRFHSCLRETLCSKCVLYLSLVHEK